MRILITGGAGFIGHNVVRLLEEQGHECCILDTCTDYGFVPKAELDYLMAERRSQISTEIKLIDIRDQTLVDAAFRAFKPTVVIHMASLPRQKIVNENPIIGSDVMVNGLLNLLEQSRKHQIDKFVYISSSMVYGNYKNNVKELATCDPIGSYGIMKYMGEKLVADYARQQYFNHVIIRPSAVYGERDIEDRVVSKFITTAIRGGTLRVNGADEVLDFTHVQDTAQGIVLAATNDVSNNRIYNITCSSRRQYTLKNAAELAIAIVGNGNLELADRDINFPTRGRLSITHAYFDLGYRPQINIEEGFRRYYKWYQDHPFLIAQNNQDKNAN